MPYFVLTYFTVSDYLELRKPFRAEHLALAQSVAQGGHLLLGGAMSSPSDEAMLVFRAPDQHVVERFVASDPYVRNGLVKEYRIRPWQVAAGSLHCEEPLA